MSREPGVSSLKAELALAFELVEDAAEIAAERFGAPDLVVERKQDGSAVSDADREIERVLRERIAVARPADPITGAELGDSGASDESEWRWYLDPIDGTAAYIAGGQNWCTLIALARRDQTQLAVVAAPAWHSRWWAVRAEGAFRDGRRLHVSTTARLADATIADDSDHTLARGVKDHPLAILAARAARVRPHLGLDFLSLAAGEIDACVSIGGFAWDYAPFELIVQEAGGRFTDLDGRGGFEAGQALATNGAIHDEAVEAVRRAAHGHGG